MRVNQILPQESQGPRHPARRGSTRRIRRGTEHLRPRRVVLGPIVGAFGEISSHVDGLADVIAAALTAEHLSYYGDRGSKTVKAYYRRVLYRAWGPFVF